MPYLAQSCDKADIVFQGLIEILLPSLVPDTFIFVKHGVIKYTCILDKSQWSLSKPEQRTDKHRNSQSAMLVTC